MLTENLPRQIILEELKDKEFKIYFHLNKSLYIDYIDEKKGSTRIVDNKFIAYCIDTKEFYYVEYRNTYDNTKDSMYELKHFKKVTYEEARISIEKFDKSLLDKSIEHERNITYINLDSKLIKQLSYSKQFQDSRRRIEYNSLLEGMFKLINN